VIERQILEMDKNPANPLARFEKRKLNYPLVITAVLLAVLLIAGVIVTFAAGDMMGTIIFVSSAGILVIIILLNTSMNRRLAAVDDRKFIHWDAAMPELQRQNVNIEVRELARVLKVDNEQLTDLLSAYIVAEDLALRQIQQEENLPLMRHVSIGKTPFDGILVDQDLIVCIEVSFVVVPDVRPERIEAMIRKMAQARTNLASMKSRLRLKLMLVIVTQLGPDEVEELEDNLRKRSFKNLQFDAIEIRMLDFEMLQKLYVSE
jgi:hypothetical protein